MVGVIAVRLRLLDVIVLVLNLWTADISAPIEGDVGKKFCSKVC